VKVRIRQQLQNRKRRIQRRLNSQNHGDCRRPVFNASNIRYEISDRNYGLAHGGIGAIHLLVKQIGLAEAINNNLQVLKFPHPYHASDHVLNLAYNTLCDGTCLQDLELRRQDEVYLDALGVNRIPDPTTAGDFCRRFSEKEIHVLTDVFHSIRQKVWARQPKEFLQLARIDMDGTLVETTGECKGGMDISYNRKWGYHPLVVSLAQTGEVLSIVNRSGNRPSHEGAAAEVNRSIRVCLEAGFQKILLRGDTDFSQTAYLDDWNADKRVKFIFGLDSTNQRKNLAEELPKERWKPLCRPKRYQVKTKERSRPENVKEQIVLKRRFQNIRLQGEEVAEIPYKPVVCEVTYRLVILRKKVMYSMGEKRLFDEYRYFFYLTNDRNRTTDGVVFEANRRCNQENLHAQLKNQVCALKAPLNTLDANWAYMVMASLAWNLKAWWALWPEAPKGKAKEKHQKEKANILGMEFKGFINAFMRLPCQIIYRVLSWNPTLPLFFERLHQLRC
jgi:hypothetical protein